MMETKYTPGPWRIGAMESSQVAINEANGEEVTGRIESEDARRAISKVKGEQS